MTGLRAGAALPSGDFESVAVGEHPSRQRSRILGASNGRIDSRVPLCGARQSQILRKLSLPVARRQGIDRSVSLTVRPAVR